MKAFGRDKPKKAFTGSALVLIFWVWIFFPIAIWYWYRKRIDLKLEE